MQDKRRISLDWKVALAVLVVVFVVYLFTLCPTVYIGPSAEAVCDAEGIGLTPATMHPIWLIAGRFVSSFSSNTAYMLNLMSALFGALTVALLYVVLSQSSHNRTAEEEARYQLQPYLRQVAAVSGALLVAFSYPFWEGSVLAGSDTLNTFLLVLVVFLAGRYARTSKARYAMLFGLMYGVAISNYPTLLLLAPIFIIFFLVRGRALLDDPVAFVVALILFFIGLFPAVYLPRAYLVHGKPYVIHATTLGQSFSVFMDSYFRSIKDLFLQKTTYQDWIFWLLAPTFVPILFFMMKHGDYERGSERATRVTYLIRYAFVLLFTFAGLGYLWGFLIGPIGMADLDFLMEPRYLSSYVVVGAWLSYIVGYWMIVLTGKFKPTATEPQPKVKYRKISYIVCVVIALALPVAGAVLSYEKSTKRGDHFVEGFAKGLLESSPREAIIVVPADPVYGSVGAPLRYVHSLAAGASSGKGTTIIIDLNAAYSDFFQVKRIDSPRYLAETVLGREVDQPRDWFLPEDPFSEVYDRILRCETLRAWKAKERARPICGLVNNFFLSPYRIENDVMNMEYRAEPAGLLYVYTSRGQYRDARGVIEENTKLWERLVRGIRTTEGKRPSQAAEYVMGEYSKSANDFGVYCQLNERLDLAERFYRQALKWSPQNSSALWNLASVMGSKGRNREADELVQKARALMKEQERVAPDSFRRLGLAPDSVRLAQTEEVLASKPGQQAEARRLGILRLTADIEPQNPTVRERIGDVLVSSARLLEEKTTDWQLRLLEARSEYVAALERTDAKDKVQVGKIGRKLALVYVNLGNRPEAERLFRKALSEDDPVTEVDLAEFLLDIGKNLDEVEERAARIIARGAANEEEKAKLAAAKSRAATVMVKVLLKQGETEKAKEFLKQYLKDRPEEEDKLLTLAGELRQDVSYHPFTIWLLGEYANRRRELPLMRLAELAELYYRQKRYDDIVGMKEPVGARPGTEAAQFYYWRAHAYEALGESALAEKTFERARSLLPEDAGYFGTVLMNNLSWRYFKNGKLAEAIGLAREAVKREPADSQLWDTYGWILYKGGGDVSEALQLVERSHLANPETGIIAYHYGKLLIEHGQKEMGMAVLETAVDLGIDGKEELEDAENILKTREA